MYMIFWCVRWVIVSLSLIFLIHHLYNYLKNTLTHPIEHSSIAFNEKRYDDMLAPVQNYSPVSSVVKNDEKDNVPLDEDEIFNGNKNPDNASMQDELQAFLSELKKND